MESVGGAESRPDVDPASLWAEIEDAGPQPHAYLGSASVDSDNAMRSEHARRRSFIAFYAYAVPTREAIAAIATFVGERPLLEIGAGLGLWARLLSDAGADVLATDAVNPRGAAHHTIYEIEAQVAIRAHPDRTTLLICWPPDKQDIAAKALLAFSGNRLVYVGDARFTANADFHKLLASDWVIVERIMLPSWPGVSDWVQLYRRRGGP